MQEISSGIQTQRKTRPMRNNSKNNCFMSLDPQTIRQSKPCRILILSIQVSELPKAPTRYNELCNQYVDMDWSKFRFTICIACCLSLIFVLEIPCSVLSLLDFSRKMHVSQSNEPKALSVIYLTAWVIISMVNQSRNVYSRWDNFFTSLTNNKGLHPII